MNKEDNRYQLDEKDGAIVFHENGDKELVLPKIQDDDMVDINSYIVDLIAMSILMRRPEFKELMIKQKTEMSEIMARDCGPSCGGCGGGCSDAT